MKVKVTKTVEIIFLLVFLAMTILSFQFNTNARLLPLTFGIIGTIMLLLQLFFGHLSVLSRKVDFEDPLAAEIESSLENENEESMAERTIVPEVNEAEQDEQEKWEWKRVLTGFFFLLMFVIMLRYLGYLVAIPIFTLLFIKIAFKAGWKLSLLVAGGTWVFSWFLFDLLLSFRV